MASPPTAFVCVVQLHLHYGQSHDLKGKRKELQSLKTVLRQRFGASVSEVDGQDTWQRATLVCALVGGREVGDRAAALERYAESRCPDGCVAERRVLSLEDIEG